ncbi:MAG: hypothetical protein ACE5E5_02195 [Phycisphaerae bacterium]
MDAPTKQPIHDDHTVRSEAARWSWPKAFLLGWCRPQTMAMGMTHASAMGCFAFHLIAFAATLAALAFVIAFAEGNDDLEELTWIFDEYDRNAVLATLIVVGNFVAIEVGMVVLGVLLAAWGARDEPLRRSMRFGIRRVWLCSTFGVVPIGVVGGLVGHLNDLHRRIAESLHLPAPAWPAELRQYQTDHPNDPEAKAKFQEAEAEFLRVGRENAAKWRKARPLYLRYDDELIALVVLGSIFLVGWCMLRTVAAPRPSRAPPRDPTCEWCGYNLITIPMESRCPECGRAVIESLGDAVRPGTRWDRRKEMMIRHPWIETIAGVVSSAQAFGRAIQLTSDRTAHRWFLFRSLVFIGSVAYAGVIMLGILESGLWTKNSLDDKVFIALLVGPIIAAVAVVGNLLLTLTAAVLVNLTYWRQDRRNLLPAAMQMAAYASGFLVLWSLVFSAVVAVLYFLGKFDYLGALSELSGLGRDTIGAIIFLTPNGICLMVYWRIVFSGTGSTRYANR